MPRDSKKLISVIGGLVVDHIAHSRVLPEDGESIRVESWKRLLGGKGANASIAAYRTSHNKPAAGASKGTAKPAVTANNKAVEIDVCMIGAVGDDADGKDVIEGLRSEGVNVDGVKKVANEQTGMVFSAVEIDRGQNHLYYFPGANGCLKPEQFLTIESLSAGRGKPDLVVSQLELPTKTVEQLAKLCHQHRIDFCLNAAPAEHMIRETYAQMTHLIVNETEAAALTGVFVKDLTEHTWQEVAHNLLLKGPENVVITLGQYGACYKTANAQGRILAQTVKVKDPTGAGDTFTGAYAAEYVRQKAAGEWNIAKAVERACRAAEHTIQETGAQQPIPWADEI